MKKILSRISIIALVLVTVMGIAIPAFACESNRPDGGYYDNDAELRQLVKSRFNPGWEEHVGFRTGGFGDPESTGVLGAWSTAAWIPSDDCVKWTLKDGVLHIYGDGETRGTDFSIYESSPFTNNQHIKTVIVTGNVRFTTGLLKNTPNLETIIFVDTPYASSPNLHGEHNVNIIAYGDTMHSYTFNHVNNTTYHVVNNLAINRTFINHKDIVHSYLPNDIAVDLRTQVWDDTLGGDIRTEVWDNGVTYLFAYEPVIVNGELLPTVKPTSNLAEWYTNNHSESLRYSRDELAAMSAAVIADSDLPDWALALIPGELGGTATAAQTPVQPAVQFTDVPADKYYAAPVQWAVEKGITSGTSSTTFSPNNTCTNAHILTFLYRAAGSPQVEASGGVANVTASDYYYNSANWANSLGMIDAAAFDPGAPCTRASTVMFLWQAAGSPTVDAATKFTDVPADADYAMAVAWALENGVTSGTSSTTFSPDATCTRGQIVTFLHRAFAK